VVSQFIMLLKHRYLKNVDCLSFVMSLLLAHRHLSIIDCLTFVMCPLLAPLVIVFSFLLLLRSFTVLMKQTRQAVRVIKQSIFCLSISMY
jgi:hypothetical protein